MPPRSRQSEALTQRNEILSQFRFDTKRLDKAKPKFLSEAQRAKLLQVRPELLKSPILLSPAKPVKGKSTLTIYTSLMVYPKWPENMGQALFSSAFPGAVFAGAQVEFPRIKKSTKHLVEFNVVLNMNVNYKFRLFRYPTAQFQDITIQGPKSETLTVLIDQLDEFDAIDFGASIQNRNTKQDDAGWSLHSVRISTI